MKITGTDADEEGNPNSQISYGIIQQEPTGQMFYIDKKTGNLFVKEPYLDREVILTMFFCC